MFHGLYRVVGHESFSRIIGAYYRRYEAGGGSSAAFVRTAQEVSKMDLTAFFNDWLFTSRWGAVVSNAKQPADLFQRYLH